MHWSWNDTEMSTAPAQGWHANSWSVSCCCCCCFNKRIKRISIWAFVCGSMGCFVALCINVLYNSAKSSINALCTGTHPEHIPFLLRKVTSLWFVTWCLTVINVRMKITSLQTCALYFNVTPQALSMLPFFFFFGLYLILFICCLFGVTWPRIAKPLCTDSLFYLHAAENFLRRLARHGLPEDYGHTVFS